MPPYVYKKLTDEDRAKIANDQVRQFESEIFGHELNIARVEALGKDATDEDVAVAAKAQDDIDTIARAIDVTIAQAATLESEEPPA